MSADELSEVLAIQAEALNRGEDYRPLLLAAPPDQRPELEALFDLAAAVKDALVPVPVPAFREQLRRALEYEGASRLMIGRPRSGRKTFWMAAAATGSVLSIAGLSVFFYRRRRGSATPTPTAV